MSSRPRGAFDPRRLEDNRRDSNVVAGVIDADLNMRSNAVHDIKVFGVGGAGNNALDRMIAEGIEGVSFIALNCDAQDLDQSLAGERIVIGERSTRRLGAGADPRLGEKAAIESLALIEAAVANADMVFITAGMGGGTGSGAGPIVARAARATGALTIGVVTTPFSFEGGYRMKVARTAVENMHMNVDSLVVINNDKLIELVHRSTSMPEALRVADSMLLNGVRGITDLITSCGFINVDFADVRKIMFESGTAMLGIGAANGEGRAQRALQQALESPLLETPMHNATGILINITAGADLGIHEINEIVDSIRKMSDQDADIVFGATIDEDARDRMSITLIATGFDQSNLEATPVRSSANYYGDRRTTTSRSEDSVAQLEPVGVTAETELGGTPYSGGQSATAYENIGRWDEADPEVPAFIRRRMRRI